MHPSIRDAYEHGTHPLAKHPIHGIYGKELAHEQFANIKDQYSKSAGSENLDQMGMMRLLHSVMQREAAHKTELETLAKQVVAQVWKADPSIFDTKLGDPGGSSEDSEENWHGDDSLTPEQQKEVHKRITLNSLTHGAAIHQMTTLHHLVKDAIDKIDPKLMAAYDKLSRGAVYSSWFASIEQITNMQMQKGGDVKVVWDNADENGQPGQPRVQATAILFPILVHELSKGVMELLTAHGLPKDEETLRKVYKHADRWDSEVFHFFVGPALWRKFLKIADHQNLPQIIAALSKQEPDELHRIISSVVDNPAEAQEKLKLLTADPDGFDVDDLHEAVMDVSAPAKPAPAPTKTTPSKPDKSTPFNPPKPAVLPKRKAGPMPTIPKTEPKTVPTPTKPDPFKPTKPVVMPKRKACEM